MQLTRSATPHLQRGACSFRRRSHDLQSRGGQHRMKPFTFTNHEPLTIMIFNTDLTNQLISRAFVSLVALSSFDKFRPGLTLLPSKISPVKLHLQHAQHARLL